MQYLESLSLIDKPELSSGTSKFTNLLIQSKELNYSSVSQTTISILIFLEMSRRSWDRMEKVLSLETAIRNYRKKILEIEIAKIKGAFKKKGQNQTM